MRSNVQTSRWATKEMAEAIIVLIHRNCHRLSENDYNSLFNFAAACKKRLPRRCSYERAAELKSGSK